MPTPTRRCVGLLLLVMAVSGVAFGQEILVARPDSNGHVFTYKQHDLFWGRVYDRGRPASLIVYASVIRAEQPQALPAFTRYQAHLKTVRTTTLVFKVFAVAATVTGLLVGPGNTTSVGRRTLGPAVGFGVIGLSGFALYHRRLALKQLKASVLSIEP
jgi:hypothetical protein